MSSDKIKQIVDKIEDVVFKNTDGIDDLEETMVAITEELKERYSDNAMECLDNMEKAAVEEFLSDDYEDIDDNFEDDYEDWEDDGYYEDLGE